MHTHEQPPRAWPPSNYNIAAIWILTPRLWGCLGKSPSFWSQNNFEVSSVLLMCANFHLGLKGRKGTLVSGFSFFLSVAFSVPVFPASLSLSFLFLTATEQQKEMEGLGCPLFLGWAAPLLPTLCPTQHFSKWYQFDVMRSWDSYVSLVRDSAPCPEHHTKGRNPDVILTVLCFLDWAGEIL